MLKYRAVMDSLIMAHICDGMFDSLGLERAREFAVLTSSQMLLLMLVQGSHFENRCTAL